MSDQKKLKEDWEDVCKKSNGTRILLTGADETEAKAFQAKLEAHIKLTNEYNRANTIFEHEKENYFFNLRMKLEKSGMDKVWEKGLAFDSEAKKEGIMVINVSQQQ